MTTMNDLFDEYLSRIQPSSDAVERASGSHNPLRNDLDKDEKYGPFVEATMLSGSYGRNTAIFDIKDVDVIIKTTFTEAELREQCKGNETTQECLLRLTQEAVQRTGRTATTRKARRSIFVKLPSENDGMIELTMDIVPVIIKTEENEDPMTISDREWMGWYDTYPNTQLADSIKRNENSKKINGRHGYKPLVKIFKAWKKVHGQTTKTTKGFILECLTGKYHDSEQTQWLDAVESLFQNICDEWPNPEAIIFIPEVPDVSDSAPYNIKIAKTVDEAKVVLRRIHRHLAIIQQAQAVAKDDLTKAAETLQRVFGREDDLVCFPLPSDLEESSRTLSKSNIREAPPFA